MTKISKKDFIEMEYTGKTKEDSQIFDTTNEKIAKENNLRGSTYGPIVICVGQGQVLKGIDDQLEGKEVGREYELEIKPEDGFGIKNPKLIRLVPTNKFKQQQIQPMPGLQVNIDGMVGTIKTVSGGRTLVDFNHPLAGSDLNYRIKVSRKVTDDKDKLSGYLKLSLGAKELDVEVNDGRAKVTLKTELPKEVQNRLRGKIVELIPTISEVTFVVKNK